LVCMNSGRSPPRISYSQFLIEVLVSTRQRLACT
jgi:hypothetical protein